ncbi:hypothetical protein [Rufibacter sp. LB8]|uniref:hypothetical protein n=1 Tax=Rufibacter sp. LB8 TaxID=2777781 RepID=UPI00178C322C|nr:hypothetical protein [Rufibacter sp. LB8]
MRFFFLILLTVLSISCNQKVYLEKSDLQWNPYKTGDVLIFKSSENELDTLHIVNVSRKNFASSLRMEKYTNEHIQVLGKYRRPKVGDFIHREILDIKSGSSDEWSEIDFSFSSYNATYYGKSELIYELKTLKEKTFITPFSVFDDVIQLTGKIGPEMLDGHFSQLSYQHRAIKKLYWSKSTGYVGFEMWEGETWLLYDKYRVERF